tara:strand:+ start:884 stop:1057 length:174 start_codon:yes stop_codon:yes gene_type:complete
VAFYTTNRLLVISIKNLDGWGLKITIILDQRSGFGGDEYFSNFDETLNQKISGFQKL